jgi:hypothetical protein
MRHAAKVTVTDERDTPLSPRKRGFREIGDVKVLRL